MLAKRIFDIVASSLGLIILSPALLLCAIWIKLDSPGSIFFTQERIGQHQKPFHIFKLRTMKSADEPILVTTASNPRITKAGRVLRKGKLDEIPQLLNVLIGDMSLVGPRPEVAKYVAYYPQQAKELIFRLKPGITDFASLRFINEEEILATSANPEQAYIEKILPMKLKYYVFYVKKRGLLLDIKLLFLTVLSVL